MTPKSPANGSATISERLADHVVRLRYEDLPAAVVEKTKDHLVHHLGVAFQGCGSAPAKQAVEVAVELSGSNGACSIIGEHRRADPMEAVFANSLLMGHNGLDDLQVDPPGGAHPGIVVQPVAWTMGEAVQASGRELLTAVVVGYDVLGKLCRPIWPWGLEPPRRSNTILGPLGAAATAARLLGLTRQQTVAALGYAGQAGNGGILEGSEAMWAIRPMAARNGLMAAMLAKAGMRATSRIIEGQHGIYNSLYQGVPDSLPESLATLGETYEITAMQIRPYPVSALDFIPMELTRRLVRDHRLEPSGVQGIDVVLPKERERREPVREDGRLGLGSNRVGRGSLRYRVATVVIDGDIDPRRFERPPQTDAAGLMDRIRLRYESGRSLRYARIELTMSSGARHVVADERYDPPPLDWNKWLAPGGRLVAQRELDRLVELIRNLEDVPDVSQVLACTVPAQHSEIGA